MNYKYLRIPIIHKCGAVLNDEKTEDKDKLLLNIDFLKSIIFKEYPEYSKKSWFMIAFIFKDKLYYLKCGSPGEYTIEYERSICHDLITKELDLSEVQENYQEYEKINELEVAAIKEKLHKSLTANSKSIAEIMKLKDQLKLAVSNELFLNAIAASHGHLNKK